MSRQERRFPWDRLMVQGLGILRLSPRDFWAATPREIAAAFPQRAVNIAPARDDLDELIKRFPDCPDGEPWPIRSNN